MNKNIQSIAPLLAVHFIEAEDSEIYEIHRKLINKNELRIGLFKKYIGSLSDSWILKTEITQQKFSILLNDFVTHVFADAIIAEKELKIDHDKLIFPIQVDFEITNLVFNTVDENGIIQTIDPIEIDEYLDEQVIACNKNSIRIGLVVWKKNKDGAGQSLLILMDAKDISVIEGQENAWSQIFNNEYMNYYQYFKSQFLIERYLSDQTICKELIDEYDKQTLVIHNPFKAIKGAT
jgi:hypothetical protein